MSGMRYAATSRALWHLTAAYTAKCFAAYSLIFWTPLVISDLLSRGGGPSVEGGTMHDRAAIALTALPYAFAAAAAYLIGWSSHAWDERRAHTYVPFAVGAVALLAAPLLQVHLLADIPRHVGGACLSMILGSHVDNTGLCFHVFGPQSQIK